MRNNYQHKPKKDACFSCLDQVLSFLKKSMMDAGPDDVYEMSLNHEKSRIVSLQKLNSGQPSFVPDWYKEWLNNQQPIGKAVGNYFHSFLC